MLELAHLAVDHGSQRALWDVSLEVREKELVGLLGANGAGKSTTLGAIIGLYPAVAGTMRYAGEDIAGRRTSRNVAAGIALVPEGRRLFAGMTVEENLAMGAYAPAARRGVREALGRVFEMFPILAEKRKQNAGELSGGQQQMAAVGRALMSNPKLLLLDEPFIGVAPMLVEEIIAVLRRIAAGGVTMLLVEQNIHRALDFVERAYVIENGPHGARGQPRGSHRQSGVQQQVPGSRLGKEESIMAKRLEGKVAIITGAAQGIGAVYAKALADEGAAVVVSDVLDAGPVAKSIKEAGGRSLALKNDVTDPKSVRAMAADAIKEFGAIDILVTNAALFGNLSLKPVTEIDSAEWDRVMAVNVRGVFECAKAVVPEMKKRKYGKIVNIASGTVFKGTPMLLHYVTSKGAVVAMTRCLARELATTASA